MTCSKSTVKATGLNIWVSGEHDHHEPTVDVIAVQGLNAHPYYTWVRKHECCKARFGHPGLFGPIRGCRENATADKVPDSSQVACETMWIRDLLPSFIPRARIATYSYESDWRRAGVKTSLRKCGEQLLNVLHQNRSSEKECRRPLVFIGHSLGGLIIKQALVVANHGDDFQDIRSSTAGIVFLGTPHGGSDVALYGEWLAQALRGDKTLLESLKTNSPTLYEIERDFETSYGHGNGKTDIVCFYEDKEAPYGPWRTQLVNQQSATLHGKRMIYLATDHSGLNKFSGFEDENFCLVRPEIQRMVENAPLEARFCSYTENLEDAEHERLLEKLAYVGNAPFSSNENQRHCRCLENTRVEVLEQIMRWAASTSPQCIFWLKGMAGTGKSTVAMTVAYQLRQITENKNLASYFFKRGFSDLAHARKLIPTIVRQLSSSSLLYRRLVLEKVRKEPDLGQSASLREQYEKLLIEPLVKLQSRTQDPFFIIIDALDECDEVSDVRLLLRLLAETKNMSNLRLRVFVTSRPELPIQLGMQEMPSILHQDLVLHDVKRSIVNKDIEVLLRHELEMVQREFCLPAHWPEDLKLQSLVIRSEGLFIFAATACRYIGGSPQADPQERLEQICSSVSTSQLMTKKLDQMYTIVLEHSVKGEYTEQERQRIHTRFRHVVGSIVVLLNPLSISELFKLIRDPELRTQHQLEITLKSLHAVLNVPEDISCSVQPLHLSFRDFLLDQNRCLDRQFWVDEKQTHHKLALDCMRLLSSSLKRNICRLPSPGTLKSEIAQRDIDNALSPAVQYACRYWADHAKKGNVELLDHGCVHKFLQQHLLHWLEAMSLMGKISETIITITNMTLMVDSQKSLIMHDLIYDCRRFVLAFRNAITDAPYQIYCSALLFSPLHSFVRKLFRDMVPQWVKIQPLPRQNWSTSLQTLEGHSGWVRTVVFSPDGQLVASGSDDGTVRLWDVQTGECRSLLKGYPSLWVCTVMFSPDGQLVAFGSEDSRVRLWYAQTGECRALLEGHSLQVNTVVFSPDGQLVASGSDDSTVRLWDVQTGECRSLLECHSSLVHIVVFSPDGQLVASGSNDSTARLWDVQTGACRFLLESDFSCVDLTMVFSPDGQLVASGSKDGTVLLWDAQTGECRSLLEGHSSSVFTVVFSPNGQLVASGSKDSTVRLWDVQTGECRSLLEGHFSEVNTVVFSPDGQLVASGSKDSTVRLWDVQTGECRSLLEGHPSEVNTVVFSPDGQLVASGSYDSTVQLWDAQIGECRSLLEGQSERVSTVVFSPDGQLVASGSTDSTVRLWDARTGECRSLLEGHSSMVKPVVFSPDGQLVASGSYDSTVRLWDVQTGECRSLLEGHSSWVNIVVFSPDGQLVASGSRDSTVRLWDVQTGECRSLLEGHSSWVNIVVFSPDGQLVASGSGDYTLNFGPGHNTVGLWDVQTGECRSLLEGHRYRVRTVVFSPDGQLVASGSDDSMRLWDVQTGECRSLLEGHCSLVETVMFSPDGQLVALGCDTLSLEDRSIDSAVRLWDTQTGEHVSTISCSSFPHIAFHTALNLVFVNGTAFEARSGTVTKTVVHDSSCLTPNFQIFVTGPWVMKSSERMLWLPPEYRTEKRASYGNMIVLGLTSGQVVFLSFKDELC